MDTYVDTHFHGEVAPPSQRICELVHILHTNMTDIQWCGDINLWLLFLLCKNKHTH